VTAQTDAQTMRPGLLKVHKLVALSLPLPAKLGGRESMRSLCTLEFEQFVQAALCAAPRNSRSASWA
jgi:hypothetical protein